MRRDLLTPDEVMRLPAGTMLLFRQGAAPILAGKVRYFADPEFQGLFDQPNASALSPARRRPGRGRIDRLTRRGRAVPLPSRLTRFQVRNRVMSSSCESLAHSIRRNRFAHGSSGAGGWIRTAVTILEGTAVTR